MAHRLQRREGGDQRSDHDVDDAGVGGHVHGGGVAVFGVGVVQQRLIGRRRRGVCHGDEPARAVGVVVDLVGRRLLGLTVGLGVLLVLIVGRQRAQRPCPASSPFTSGGA